MVLPSSSIQFPASLTKSLAPPWLCCRPIAPHQRISVCHTRDGTVLPGIVINGRNSAWKIPLSGCQLAYAEKKLITAVSWADGAGKGVSDCAWVPHLCVCVLACEGEREREKQIFVHVSKHMHVCPPLPFISHHAWISVSTCLKCKSDSVSQGSYPSNMDNISEMNEPDSISTPHTQTLQHKLFNG